MNFNIVCIPSDGIGPEILMGGASIDVYGEH